MGEEVDELTRLRDGLNLLLADMQLHARRAPQPEYVLEWIDQLMSLLQPVPAAPAADDVD